jgi:hypothetical protein
MGILFLLVCFSTLAYGIKTQNIRTASFISMSILTLSASNYILTFYEMLTPENFIGLPIRFEISEKEFYKTLYIYFPFLIATAISLLLNKAESSKFQATKKMNSSIRINKSFMFILIFYFITLIFLILIHILEINWSIVYENREYLLLVNPNKAGLQFGLTKLFHNSMSFLNIINIVLFIVILKTKNYKILYLLAPIIIYITSFKLIQFSRWVPLYFIIAILAINYLSNKRKMRLTNTALILLAIFFYYVSILGRGQAEQGVVGFFKLTTTINIDKISYFFQSLFQNIFGGFFITAKATLLHVTYPFEYKILSFSFLPGFVDGWNIANKNEIRINEFTPFNVYSELYHFGLSFYIIFTFIYFFILRYIDGFIKEKKGILSLMLLCVTAFFLISAQFYPIRNSIKIITIFLIITIPFHFTRKKS